MKSLAPPRGATQSRSARRSPRPPTTRRRWLVATILLFVGLLSAQIAVTYAVGLYGANEGQRFWFDNAGGAVREFEDESYSSLEQDLSDLRRVRKLRELVQRAPGSAGGALQEEWPTHEPDDFLLVVDSARIAASAGVSPCGVGASPIDPTRPRQLAMCGSQPVLLAQVPSDGPRRIVAGRVLGPAFLEGVKQVTGNEVAIVGSDGVVVHTFMNDGRPSNVQLGSREVNQLLHGPTRELTHLRIPLDRYAGFGAPRFSAGGGSLDAWVYALPLDDRNGAARLVLVVPRAVLSAGVNYQSAALVFAGIICVVLASAIASRWIRRLVRPLEELGRKAEAVAAGDFATRIPERGDAEIVALQATFNRMTAELGARSKLLEDRNRELRLVLDHVADGLFVMDRKGRLQGAASAALVAWFGEPAQGAPAWEYLAPSAPAFAESFELGWLAVSDDFVSLDLALDQLPRAFSAHGRCYEVAYDPVLDTNLESAFVLAVVRDVTAQLAQDEADAAQRELATALRRLAADRAAFLEQFSELDALVGRVLAGDSPRNPPNVEWRRWVHTIKGSSAMLDLHGISAACGRIEASLAPGAPAPGGDVLDALRTRWAAIRDPLAAELAASERTVVVELDALVQLAAAIGRGDPQHTLLAKVDGMLQEPVEKRLQQLAKHVQWLADRAGKGGIAVSVQANAVMIERRGWGPLWAALVHVVRNAVAHGIEPERDRIDSGKTAIGNVRLSAAERDGAVLVEISDDGRGIDWEVVRAAAVCRGVAAGSAEELESALFTDGITTTTTPNEISGRGEGLAAVLAATKALGGAVTISTARGLGTTFTLRVPRSREDRAPALEAQAPSSRWGELRAETTAVTPKPSAGGSRHTRASLLPFLASSLGMTLSEQLVARCAEELQIEQESFTAESAVTICDRIAQEPGLVGIAARFARTRIASAWGASGHVGG